MGNRRSVEKALEHVGAASLITARPRRDPRRRRDRRARRRRVPARRCGACARSASTSCCASAPAPACRCSASASACSCCSSRSDEHERRRRPRPAAAATSTRLDARGLKAPAHRLEPGHVRRAASPLTDGLGDARGLLPRALATPAGPPTSRRRRARATTASAFASIVERGNVFGAQFHPEKSSRDGLALLRNFAGVCARVPA